MSKRYLVAVRDCQAQSVVFPLADARNLQLLKKKLTLNLCELVLAREVADWLRPAAYRAVDPSWGMPQVPDIMWASVHRYDSEQTRVDLIDPDNFVVAYLCIWADRCWRVFQIHKPEMFSKVWTMRKPEQNSDSLAVWSDILSVSLLSPCFGFHELTPNRCKAILTQLKNPVGGIVVKEWGELLPFDWVKIDDQNQAD